MWPVSCWQEHGQRPMRMSYYRYDWIGTDVDEDKDIVTNSWESGMAIITSQTQTGHHSWYFVLEPVKDKDGQFYLVSYDQSGAYYLSSDGTTDINWSAVGVKNKALKFKFTDDKKGIVLAEDTKITNKVTWKAGSSLVFEGTSVTLKRGANALNKPTELAFAIWNNAAAVDGNALQTSYEDNEYYLIFDGTDYLVGAEDGSATFGSATADVDEYLWKVSSKTVGGVVKYEFTNKKTGKVATVGSNDSFASDREYNGVFVLTGMDKDDPAATVELGIYKSPIVKLTNTDLNKILGGGFGINVKVGDKVTLQGTNAISGKLTAVSKILEKDDDLKDYIATGADAFYLMSGNKYVALTTGNDWNISNTGSNKRGGKFVLVSKKVLEDKDNAGKYLSVFSIDQYAGLADESVNVISVTNEAKSETRNMYAMALSATKSILTGSVDIVDGETWPTITLGMSNVAKVEQFLGSFWNISFAATKAEVADDIDGNPSNNYKVGRVLALVGEYATPEYVPASSVENGFPEAQWGIVTADLDYNSFTLANRENPDKKISGIVLRTVEGEDDVYVVSSSDDANLTEGDKIKMTKVANPDPSDGYARYTVNELRNTTFYMGQYHAIAGNNNVYFSENHGDSHLLGVVTDKEGAATVWNLDLKMVKDDKGNETAVADTVYVKFPFATLNADGDDWETDAEKIKTSTLKILPYVFQNRANGEYVKYNGTKGYECYTLGENDEVNGYTDKDVATVFALKMQPNGTYNIVEIDEATAEPEDSNLRAIKIQVANSEIDGFGKLIREGMYVEDDNTLMVVEERETPEYHKVAEGWGDVVRIFNADNESRVLYEHIDKEAIVENDTTRRLS